MKYKVVDIQSHTEEDVQFGTCDLCMSLGDLDYEIVVLENQKGEQCEIETGVWDWGDYNHLIYIENIVDFSAWLIKQDVEEEMSTYTLRDLVDEYEEETK